MNWGSFTLKAAHDPTHARNLYLLALDSWGKENSGKDGSRTIFFSSHITTALSKLEQHEHNIPKAD